MKRKHYMSHTDFLKKTAKIIFRIFLISVAIALLPFPQQAHADSTGITWKTHKAGKGYITTIYAQGKTAGKIRTAKKLPVKVIASKKCTAGKVNARRGKYILIEKINGRCINRKGDGRTTGGNYIKYRKARKGDKFTTYAVYADSKYIDDIAIRVDIKR